MNQENQINFLDTTVFINSKNELEFKKYRKNGLQTVISNFEEAVVSKKYLKGGILTNLHRELDLSSSHENFLETLEELKEVYSRNSYPPAQKLLKSIFEKSEVVL
jgi:pyruvate/oxaloacetate carboxyltransferase